MKCFDTETHVAYPAHEWHDGICQRCGKKQPGVSDEARGEIEAQRVERLTRHLHPRTPMKPHNTQLTVCERCGTEYDGKPDKNGYLWPHGCEPEPR